MSRHYDPSIILSDEEARISKLIGRNDTYYILEEMRRRHPDCKFIWAMGADSFSKFHEWKERDDILEKYIVAVVGRPGFTRQALSSPTAIDFSNAAFDYKRVKDFRYQRAGWCFVDVPQSNFSSTELLQKLRVRSHDFKENFLEVADYAYAHELYQSNGNNLQLNGERTCPTDPNNQFKPNSYTIAR